MSIDAATAAIAHEIRSSLASIPLNVEAARLQLRMEAPDLPNVDVILQDIETSSLRVNATISSVRELFKTPCRTISPLFAVDCDRLLDR